MAVPLRPFFLFRSYHILSKLSHDTIGPENIYSYIIEKLKDFILMQFNFLKPLDKNHRFLFPSPLLLFDDVSGW